MHEVRCPESPPGLMPAVATYVHQPRQAQHFLHVVNALYPLGPAEAHLKRIRKVVLSSQGDNPNTIEHGEQTLLEVIVHTGSSCRTLLDKEAVVSASDDGDPAHGARSCTLSDKEYRTPSPHHLTRLYAPFRAKLSARLQSCGEAGGVQSLHVVRVPTRAPRHSPELWVEWNAVWPLASPKPHPLESPTPELIADVTHRMIQSLLPLCLRLPAHVLPVAALVVDPATQRVLVTSEACSSMCHCQRAACVPYCELKDLARRHAHRETYAAARSWSVPRSSCSAHRSGGIVMEHPVTYVLKKLAALQQTPRVMTGRTDSARTIDQTQPYLANELDLYVSHEPCVMCAMALVHSRIQRVFFCLPNPHHGGLGSVFAVHTIPSLNHHYRAYCCTDAAQCLERALGDSSGGVSVLRVREA